MVISQHDYPRPPRSVPLPTRMRRAPALLLLAAALPAAATSRPAPVSPGAAVAGELAEVRCPTFSWAGVSGARGYELAVYRLSGDSSGDPLLVTRMTLPADSRSWTPPSSRCLERGGRYAWSVAASGGQLDWSSPLLFEVEAAPSIEEVEQAMATLDRYLERGRGGDGERIGADRVDATAIGRLRAARASDIEAANEPHARRARPTLAKGGLPSDALPVPLVSPTTGIARVTSAGAAPTLGDASLRVSSNISLGAMSNVFKNEQLFLWDSFFGDLALGRYALGSVQGITQGNTAIGMAALANTTVGNLNTATGAYVLYSNTTGTLNTATGYDALRDNTTGDGNTAIGTVALAENQTGMHNSAVGLNALRANTTGSFNTAIGVAALFRNTTGQENTAGGMDALRNNTTGDGNTATGRSALRYNTVGFYSTATGTFALLNNTSGSGNTANGVAALRDNVTGDGNTAIGAYALANHETGNRNSALGYQAGNDHETGDDNVLIHSPGIASESNVLRIGSAKGSGDFQLEKAFIHGIRGTTTGVADAVAVLVDSAGQLGTTSSSRRVKQDVRDLEPLAYRLLELHPVAFRYRQHVVTDPDTPLQFGLIAEEVAAVFPELVVYDDQGRPETVKYHLLSSLLLAELQRQDERVEALEEARTREVAALASELERVTRRPDPLESRPSSSSPGR